MLVLTDGAGGEMQEKATEWKSIGFFREPNWSSQVSRLTLKLEDHGDEVAFPGVRREGSR